MGSNDTETVDLAILGGGIVGLSVAWRARAHGMSVAVIERGALGGEATRVAAGMLAPVAEVEFGEAGRRVLELGLRSARMWPEFAQRLERAAGTSVGLRRSGTLVVARDDDEARELERQLAFRESLGLRAERLRASAARELEPALAPTVRLALHAPDDHSVEPRAVVAALRRACERAGVRLREHTAAVALQLDGGGARVEGVRVRTEPVGAPVDPAETAPPRGEDRVSPGRAESGCAPELVRARDTVVAMGAWSAQIDGVPAGAGVDVRPVKGQILRLRDPAGPGLLERVVRFEAGYLVPRGDGRYVLGATVEERGFEREPTAGGVYGLLREAHELVPGIEELRIEELGVGFRPGTPDNAPIVGRSRIAGLTWATGHHRNGILLAPLTAEAVVEELLAGESSSTRVAGGRAVAHAGEPA